MPITALRDELAAVAANRLAAMHIDGAAQPGGYFPGWHGITERGW